MPDLFPLCPGGQDNIVLITTDQQRFDTIQAHGNRYIFTPHLNYMASEGVSFTRCYADCPICVPSRTTIMTGLAGYESGVVSNGAHQAVMEAAAAGRRTLPARLTDAGYQTRAAGKMHFDPARACYGFEAMTLPLDYMRYWDRNRRVASPKAHGVGECEMEPVLSTVEARDSVTAWIVERSIDFIETRDPLRPFFLWTSFTKPHPPFDPCRDYWDLYEGMDMPDPVYGDWSRVLEDAPQGFLAGSYENTNMHLFSPQQVRASRRAYYALITQVDYALGRLFGCMRENGLLENTWLVFTSDHGEMLGDHHMSQKNLFFEGSAHVPLIIVPPKKYRTARGRRSDTLAQIADLYPSLLDMAGLAPPENGAGRSLLRPTGERVFYGNSLNRHFCVLRDQKKLVYSACGGHYLLFDLSADPMERHDLTRDHSAGALLKDLRGLLLEQVAGTAPAALKDGDFIAFDAPKFPGDVDGRWFGFHYQDYSVDTFH